MFTFEMQSQETLPTLNVIQVCYTPSTTGPWKVVATVESNGDMQWDCTAATRETQIINEGV